ncbi:hypothetical protein L3X38_032730 [Prunus dulcis]|uniref:Uncharacterized protein n=1 Tax=Prunus dulcis TaxID=3755 RepID=A0AAD4VEW2_PRUDU|nr:hypothetical protein L3X38_032730 [Prunus dulcis]
MMTNEADEVSAKTGAIPMESGGSRGGAGRRRKMERRRFDRVRPRGQWWRRLYFSLNMVSKSQSKEAQLSKGQSKDVAVSKAHMSEAKYVQSNPAKKMRFTSTSEKDSSSATFDEETKLTSGINTMSRVVKRKIPKIKPVVEYNKSGRPHGKAAIEMQSYIGVLARIRVPLVDKKWAQLPKDLKEQIWEAVQMAYVVGERGQEDGAVVCHQKMEGFQVYLN